MRSVALLLVVARAAGTARSELLNGTQSQMIWGPNISLPSTEWLVHECGCRRIAYVHVPKAGGSTVLRAMHTNPVLSALLLRHPQPDPYHWYHVTAEDQRKFYGEKEWGDALKIATVRNPFTRFVSGMVFTRDYSCAGLEPHKQKPASEVCSLLHSSSDLKKLLERVHQYLQSRGPQAIDNFYSPQTKKPVPATQKAWLHDRTGVQMDIVAHLENETEFASVAGHPTSEQLNNLLCNQHHRLGQQVPNGTRRACEWTLKRAFPEGGKLLHQNGGKYGDPFASLSPALCAFLVDSFAEDFTQFGYNSSECAARVSP